MPKRESSSRFWSKSQRKWNFGDALSFFLYEKLFVDFVPYNKIPWTIGSVLFDGAPIIEEKGDNVALPSFLSDQDCAAVFWGCGLRNEGSLSAGLAERSAILGVRGPLSASDLRLGAEIPLGDPALLIKALYTPKSRTSVLGKTVCAPHYLDQRPDTEIRTASGCEVVLRSAIEPNIESIERFIDAICSADFVLCGSLHAAIIAAAYGVPFGYWNSGSIDVPFKWADFSALIEIPCVFHDDLEPARRHYETAIQNSIALPSMWPLLCAAPLFIRPAALIRVLRHELVERGAEPGSAFDELLGEIEANGHHIEHLTELSRQITDQLVPALITERDSAHARLAAQGATVHELASVLETEREQARANSASASSAIAEYEARLAASAELHAKELETMTARLDDLCREKEALEARLLVETQGRLADKRLTDEAQGALQEADRLRDELQARLQSLSEQAALREADLAAKLDATLTELGNRNASELEAQAALQEADRLQDELQIRLQAWTEQAALREAQMSTKLDATLTELAEQRLLREQASKNLESAHQTNAALQSHLDATSAAAAEREKQLVAQFEAQLRQQQAETASERELAAQTNSVLEAERVMHESALAQIRTLSESELAASQAQLGAVITRIGHTVRRIRSGKWTRRLLRIPFIGKYDARLKRNTDQIMAFLARFTEAELGMSATGREDRVLAYLLGATSCVADLPLIDRNAYCALHEDVAGAKIDPFIHYINFGQAEGRTPHPLLDYGYYTEKYPETARYDATIIEHFIRFGVPKKYNPCEGFDTSAYLKRHPDVGASGYNPLIHYIRYPGCRPSDEFDSDFYRKHYPDVVRSGFNPLAHYLMYGRDEQRRTTAGAVAPATAPTRVPPVEQAPFPHQQPTPAEPVTISDIGALPMAPATQARPLVVMMDAFFPQPDMDSGSLDQVNFARIFNSLGYDVAFAALMDFAPDRSLTAAISEAGASCITADDFINIEEFLFLNADRIAAFFLSRFNFGGSWIERARTFCPQACIIFNTVDLHHVREERQAILANDPIALGQAQATKAAELSRIAAADVTIVVSQVEREILNKLAPDCDVRTIPLIREIHDRIIPGFEDRNGIAFVGGFRHQPNIDAVTSFLDSIWPLILEIEPEMKFYVIGSHMPEALSQRTDRNVEWIGYVPDLQPFLDRVRLTVAPLRYGAGAKGKVVSSLMNAVPVVATQIAQEGMGIVDGDGIFTATDPAGFAKQVVSLHEHADLWARASQRGYEAVRQAYSLERGVSLIEEILPRRSAA